jgi:hypothetical protein
VARKRTRKKRRSCALCKPHKMKGGCRWKPKDQMLLTLWERDKE